ncbi:hypothetical protein [Microbacterium invictum]|uniref:Uncharacterized protein n=1 Tax=Microbacterium invictum TaxID=515415 RepID=A0AA40SPI7_9MICO|nr:MULTISPECIES: hypothetical protein [Microbacterium]MBB4140003.1 hypothetical protein [Microbacterium invictum]
MNSDETPTTPLPDDVLPPEPTPAGDPERVAPTRTRPAARPLLIGAATGVAVLLVGGVGIGAIAALNDRGTFPAVPAAEVSDVDAAGVDPTADTPPADTAADAERRAQQERERQAQEEAARQAAEAQDAASGSAALVVAIDLAVTAAQGTGASSVELESYGWSVDVILPDGSEVDVRVARDGTTTVRADHRDDEADPPIDTARIDDIVAAAIGAAGPGIVTSIETDDGTRYDVTVAREAGGQVEVELAADLTVIAVDRD